MVNPGKIPKRRKYEIESELSRPFCFFGGVFGSRFWGAFLWRRFSRNSWHACRLPPRARPGYDRAPMRILTYIATDQITEASRFVLDFARAAIEGDHTAYVFALVESWDAPGLTALGGEADRLDIPFRILHRRMQYDPGILGQLGAAIDRIRPDVLQTHGWSGCLLARAVRRRRVPWQAVLYGSSASEPTGAPQDIPQDIPQGIGGKLALRWLRQAGQVIAETPELREKLLERKIAGEKLWTLPALTESEDASGTSPSITSPERVNWLLQNTGRVARTGKK